MGSSLFFLFAAERIGFFKICCFLVSGIVQDWIFFFDFSWFADIMVFEMERLCFDGLYYDEVGRAVLLSGLYLMAFFSP